MMDSGGSASSSAAGLSRMLEKCVSLGLVAIEDR